MIFIILTVCGDVFSCECRLLKYPSLYQVAKYVKSGIVIEVGFQIASSPVTSTGI